MERPTGLVAHRDRRHPRAADRDDSGGRGEVDVRVTAPEPESLHSTGKRAAEGRPIGPDEEPDRAVPRRGRLPRIGTRPSRARARARGRARIVDDRPDPDARDIQLDAAVRGAEPDRLDLARRSRQAGCPRVDRRLVDRCRRSGLDDPAGPQQHDPVGDGQRLARVVGRVDPGRARPTPGGGDLVEESVPERAVEMGGRLVEEVQPRVPGKGPTEPDALLLPARHLGRAPSGQVGDPEAIEDLGRLPPGGLDGDATAPDRVGDRVQRRQVRPERRALEHHADIAPLGRLVSSRGGHEPSAEPELAGPDRHEAGDRSEDRRLARAGRPEEDDHLVGRDGQVESLDHEAVVVADGHADELDRGWGHDRTPTAAAGLATATLTTAAGRRA